MELEEICSSSEDDSDEESDEFKALHAQWMTKAEDLSELEVEAGKWKHGRWTPRDIATLKENLKEFLTAKNIKDPAEIIFSDFNSKIRLQFYRSIARNIRRPLFSVYRKACREFNIENYVHKWRPEMVEQLLGQHLLHGNKWATIGRSMGISARAVRDKYREISKRKRTGEWQPEEEERLVLAMKRVHGDSIVSEVVVTPSPDTPTWIQVAKIVKTRNSLQCRAKWLFCQSGIGDKWKKRWREQDDLRLLNRLCEEQNLESEEEVNWMELYSGWENVRSPHFLRSKWGCLRRRVPGYSLKSFEENLDYLVEHVIPILEKKLKAKESDKLEHSN